MMENALLDHSLQVAQSYLKESRRTAKTRTPHIQEVCPQRELTFQVIREDG